MITKKRIIVSSILLSLVFLTSCSFSINIPSETKDANNDIIEDEKFHEEEHEKDMELYLEEFLNKEVLDLEMKNLNGDLINIKEIEGPFLLNFSRVTCPSCVELYSTLLEAKKDLEIIEVYYRDSKNEILDMFKENNFIEDLSILSGIEDLDNNNVMADFKLIAVPTTFFIDSDKIVQHIEMGSMSYDILSGLVKEHLNK